MNIKVKYIYTLVLVGAINNKNLKIEDLLNFYKSFFMTCPELAWLEKYFI